MSDLGPLLPLARAIVESCTAKGLLVVTAESCTGGLIAGTLTEIPGSSAIVDRGFVTYSNEAKSEMLGVPKVLIRAHGAVSRAVAVAMAEGAIRASRAHLAVAVTGVAGPGGGSEDKPVGTVHFALARRGSHAHHIVRNFGDIGRSEVRLATVRTALELIAAAVAATSAASG